MGKAISKDYDPRKGAPALSSGTDPFDNPGIMPSEKNIAQTPGEKATNPAAAYEVNKGQPYGKGGSGYTK
jgi:hypothetical protein